MSKLKSNTVLELTVANHPGVMSHICGLFSRRAYNLEGILCLPLAGGKQSCMWLWVDEDDRLEQVVKQVSKLQDVLEVKHKNIDEALVDSFNFREIESRK